MYLIIREATGERETLGSHVDAPRMGLRGCACVFECASECVARQKRAEESRGEGVLLSNVWAGKATPPSRLLLS